MSNNASSLCSQNNPTYKADVSLDENSHWSGCALASNASAAPVLESCCDSLGDVFELTYQDWFQLFPETQEDDMPCYTVCLTNTSDTYYADSQNVTDCVRLSSEEDDVEVDRDLFRCAGPTMKTPDSAAARRFDREPTARGLGLAVVIAVLAILQ